MIFADKHLNFNALLGIHYEVVWATKLLLAVLKSLVNTALLKVTAKVESINQQLRRSSSAKNKLSSGKILGGYLSFR